MKAKKKSKKKSKVAVMATSSTAAAAQAHLAARICLSLNHAALNWCRKILTRLSLALPEQDRVLARCMAVCFLRNNLTLRSESPPELHVIAY